MATHISTAPDLPTLGDDSATFDSQAHAFFSWLKTDLQPNINDIADEAETNANNAGTSATNAATSETNAAASASAASTSETNAASSASAAATSETNAATSESNALSYLNDFKGRYYGSYSSDPSTDPLGNAINEGDIYYNSTDKQLKFYNGTNWEQWSNDADTLDGHDGSYFANTTLSNVNDSDVLTKVKNVDGSGSGLDADKLDGQEGSYYGKRSVSDFDETDEMTWFFCR